MAFNKSKALESALKYLNQGKVNQAIAEYQQILRYDAKDQATLMTVGDLFARQGDMAHALEYFERLAQVYLTDGFNSKAIAIYKKIAKLAPSEIAPLERLANLYVQQGVLSEARPLFLQIAEAHLKANRAPKAVEVLHRLLEVEPENPRVQMRLAELYNVMGKKGDAAKTYLSYAQRMFDRGESGEAEKLIDRAFEVAPADPAALLLKSKIQAAAGKDATAIKILEKHPEADGGTEVTNLLVDLELKTGQIEAAADRARNQLVRGNSHFGLLLRVTENLVQGGKVEEALPLFRELRDPMIEVNEHDKFVKLLSAATDRLPNNTEALELLADFCRHTSDPFPLNVALIKLVDIYEAAGNEARAEELLEELVDRNRDDERSVARLEGLRVRIGKSPRPARPALQVAPDSHPQVETVQTDEAQAPASAVIPVVEATLDSETQHYIAQALTDVDLFSSYGLTQKASNLLESILERAPCHTPTLERLLDLSLGTGNDRRTAQLAATLEKIHRDREDRVNADRFAELRKRYQSAAGMSDDELTSGFETAKRAPQPEIEPGDPASVGAVPVDRETAAIESTSEAGAALETQTLPAQQPAESPQTAAGDEVDLSDEWEAMVQEVVEPPPAIQEFLVPAVSEPGGVTPEVAETIAAEAVAPSLPLQTEGEELEVFEITDDAPELSAADVSFHFGQDVVAEIAEEAPAVVDATEFELELTPETPFASQEAATTEEFISELASEFEDMQPPVVAVPDNGWAETPVPPTNQPQPRVEPAAEVPVDSVNQLAEVFQEFRSELGELGEEDEDLETHYNLGIAYREMGLLDEAIGEFQKVAKAVEKGKPFRYAMNCATLLALSFREKGEPKIASLWYNRALEVPGLEQETVLALRYDLGISLEMAGESDAALDCFRQVYAMNIDYRDVADRIATLQHR
jgi:tetratricopeptide (TPR) repeat protein